ncbi:MAG: restriction endonuclease, partial [Calditrichaeota bacterium]
MNFSHLRKNYHLQICKNLLIVNKDSKKGEYPNNADSNSKISIKIAWEILNQICEKPVYGSLSVQKASTIFQQVTKDFLEKSFALLRHIRPGKWLYSINTPISSFGQYKDLAKIEKVVKISQALATSLGSDYIMSPDIVVGREPVSDQEINKAGKLIDNNEAIATLTPLREANFEYPEVILHASISCKWTLRSDRAQNSRTEALNLIRNRKGH